MASGELYFSDMIILPWRRGLRVSVLSSYSSLVTREAVAFTDELSYPFSMTTDSLLCTRSSLYKNPLTASERVPLLLVVLVVAGMTSEIQRPSSISPWWPF